MGPQEGYSPRTLRDVLWDTYYDLIPLITANLLWVLLTLPVVTAFPAIAGLAYSANQIAKGKSVDWRTFFEGFKEHLGYSFKWGLLTLLGYAVLFISLSFYNAIEASWAVLLAGMMIGFIIIWTIIQLYTLPLVFEQVDKSIKMALRNSLVLFLKRPLPTFGLMLGIFAIVAVTIILPPVVFVISPALIYYFINKNMLKSLHLFKQQAEAAPDTSAETPDTTATTEQPESE
ncbi:MAG: YesL family protein [Anaerolineales bacterium]|nr:YesL family protein [Anaerolineales bacterium]